MKLKKAYNKLVIKVDTYLRQRRESGKWERHLPESMFDAHLWLWEKRSLQLGAAWGAVWAIAPVPMQSLFTLLCCIFSKGNVPVGVLACWVSIPGYQIIAWPLQWALGAWCLHHLGISSGASASLVEQAARMMPEGFQSVLNCLSAVHLSTFLCEFLLGCLISCGGLGLLFYTLVGLIVREDATPPQSANLMP